MGSLVLDVMGAPAWARGTGHGALAVVLLVLGVSALRKRLEGRAV
jgi:hypothetical protein